jgi:hypothetical protein
MEKNYQLTILCPGIRTKNWEKLYRSVEKSFSGSWEIIFIGPVDIPIEFKTKLIEEGKTNARFIHDMGSPIRCQQIGLVEAKGEWINWAADDGEFLPGALDVGFKKLEEYENSQEGESMGVWDPKVVIMQKYFEGETAKNDSAYSMDKDFYYVLSNHDATRLPGVPKNYFMLNVGLVSRAVLLEIGGWDAETFQVCPMAYNDCAIRLQNHGCKFIVQDEIAFACSHMPGITGDHGPIHCAQVYKDQPMFSRIYRDPAAAQRIHIDLNNWQKAPERWEMRFGKAPATSNPVEKDW